MVYIYIFFFNFIILYIYYNLDPPQPPERFDVEKYNSTCLLMRITPPVDDGGEDIILYRISYDTLTTFPNNYSIDLNPTEISKNGNYLCGLQNKRAYYIRIQSKNNKEESNDRSEWSYAKWSNPFVNIVETPSTLNNNKFNINDKSNI